MSVLRRSQFLVGAKEYRLAQPSRLWQLMQAHLQLFKAFGLQEPDCAEKFPIRITETPERRPEGGGLGGS
jgi:hypothetical protein